MNLYEISVLYDEAFRVLSVMDDLPEGCMEDTLSGFEAEMKDLAVNFAAMMKNMEAKYLAIDEAVKGMKRRSDYLKNRYGKFESYLIDALKRAQIDKIHHANFDITLRNNPESVLIEHEREIPERFWVEKPAEKRIDKTSIKEAIKNGSEVPGAKLIRNVSLSIK